MAALYDGPVETVDYVGQPAILEKLPALGDGDALTRTFRVRGGERVVDAEGQVVELVEGVRVRPAGCYSPDCAVVFANEPMVMERLEVTFALRPDLTWSDGEPLTARDSVFAYRIAADPRTPGDHDLAERTFDYRALDDWRVKWIGLPGFVDAAYQTFFFAPLPRHQLEGRSAAALLRADETRRSPLTWGPFIVSEWAIGERITLSRNPHYFRAAEGLPVLDQLIFVFAADPADVAARVLSGECDLGLRDDGYDPFVPLLTRLERRGLLQVPSVPGTRGVWLELGVVPAADVKRPDYFGDARVRQAIARCIDRQALVDTLTDGRGAVLQTLVPPTHPLNASSTLSRSPYDPAAALRLLEEAGWVDTDGDGVSEAHGLSGIPDGTPFSVTLLVPWSRTPLEEVARIVRANLADCGIQVTLRFAAWQEVLADEPAAPLAGRRFEMAVREREWQPTACRAFLSSEIPTADRPDGPNISGYSNPDFDAACIGALTALPGTAAHDAFQQRVVELFAQELPAIPLFAWAKSGLARPGVLNLAVDATSASELWRAEMLDVEW